MKEKNLERFGNGLLFQRAYTSRYEQHSERFTHTIPPYD